MLQKGNECGCQSAKVPLVVNDTIPVWRWSENVLEDGTGFYTAMNSNPRARQRVLARSV